MGRSLTSRGGTSARHARSLFLAIAAASAGLVIATLSVEGLSYVNLDSLLEEGMRFYARLVVPASLATISLVAGALPRIVTINLGVFVGLVLVRRQEPGWPPPGAL